MLHSAARGNTRVLRRLTQESAQHTREGALLWHRVRCSKGWLLSYTFTQIPSIQGTNLVWYISTNNYSQAWVRFLAHQVRLCWGCWNDWVRVLPASDLSLNAAVTAPGPGIPQTDWLPGCALLVTGIWGGTGDPAELSQLASLSLCLSNK